MPLNLTLALLVFLGGGLGSLARYGVNLVTVATFGPHYPWGTLTVNVVGSVIMGGFAGYLMTREMGAAATPFRLFFMTGVMGGFTTFSAFSLDTVVLWQKGAAWTAAGYVLLSVVLSIVALVAGMTAVKALLAP